MHRTTTIRVAVAFSALLAGLAGADAPATFPARFTDSQRLVAVGVSSGNGVTRRHVERSWNENVLVFDDAMNLHFEAPGTPEPTIDATWTSPSRRRVEFRLTAESASRLAQTLAASIPFPVQFRISAGRFKFSRDGSYYRGRQVLRVSGRFRGLAVSVVETIHHTGTREAD